MGLYRKVRASLGIGELGTLRLVEENIRSSKIILDIGCGRNSPILEMNRRAYKIGVDSFLPYLKEARGHDSYIYADARHLPIRGSSVDCAIALDVLEHLQKSDGEKLLAEAERASSKKIVLTTPNGFAPQDSHIDGNPGQKHRSGWSKAEFEEGGYDAVLTGISKRFASNFSRILYRVFKYRAIPKHINFVVCFIYDSSYLLVKLFNFEPAHIFAYKDKSRRL